MLRMLWALATVAVCQLIGAIASDAQGFSLSRAAVVKELDGSIQIHLGPKDAGGDTAALDALVKRQIDLQASEALPKTLNATSQEIFKIAVDNPLVITYRDDSYVHAVVKLHLIAVPLSIKFLEAFPPVNDQTKTRIQQSLDKTRAVIESKLDAGLIPLNISGLNREAISKATNVSLGSLAKQIGNPLSYTLALPLSDTDIDALAADFETRLQDNCDFIQKRIITSERQRGGVARDPGLAIAFTLQQVLAGPRKFVIQHTSDPQRRAFVEKETDSQIWQDAEKEYSEAVVKCMRRESLRATPTTTP